MMTTETINGAPRRRRSHTLCAEVHHRERAQTKPNTFRGVFLAKFCEIRCERTGTRNAPLELESHFSNATSCGRGIRTDVVLHCCRELNHIPWLTLKDAANSRRDTGRKKKSLKLCFQSVRNSFAEHASDFHKFNFERILLQQTVSWCVRSPNFRRPFWDPPPPLLPLLLPYSAAPQCADRALSIMNVCQIFV